MHKPNSSSKFLIPAFVAAAFGLTAGAAFAQTSKPYNAPVGPAVPVPTTSRSTTLTSLHSTRTFQYPSARDLSVCNLSGHTPSGTAAMNSAEQRSPETRPDLAVVGPGGSATPVTLQVSYNGRSEQIQPGNCYEFRARNVRLSPAQQLPAGAALQVSVGQVSGTDFVNGKTIAASSQSSDLSRTGSNAGSNESVEQLSAQLKHDDEQMRQANAELSQARAKLAQTTRKLKQAEAKERRVASAERHTANAERQEQQNAQHDRQNAQSEQQSSGTPR